MPRVKIVWSNHISLDDYQGLNLLVGATDWEEISDEELDLLRRGLHFISGTYEPHLLIADEKSVRDRLVEITVARQKDDARRAQQEANAKKAAKARKTASVERRRKQYERLRREFEAAHQ